MTVSVGVQPLRDLVLVERVTERISKGGIVLPETWAGTNSQKLQSKQDYWRGRVLAVGPETRDLAPGEEVLVHTWSAESGKGLYTGVGDGSGRVFIGPDDIICAVEPEAA